jgi:hypothetical protein
MVQNSLYLLMENYGQPPPMQDIFAESKVGLGIGKRVIDQPFYFSGAIDEVTIYKETRY